MPPEKKDQEAVNHTDIVWIKQTLLRIEQQTTKTNGRVTSLESFRAKVVAYGSIAVVVIPILISKFF